jgi:hypothetical protein
MLATGLAATSANAGLLSIRFAGGGSEVTLAPSESATIEVVFQMQATDKKTNQVTGFDARFEVGQLATSDSGDYVADGSTKLMVSSAGTTIPGWNTAATSGVGEVFNSAFFMSAGDPGDAPPDGPVGNGTEQAPVVLASFTVHKEVATPGIDTLIAFRAGAALPAVYQGAAGWTSRFGFETINGGGQFEIGLGNPGQDRPQDVPPSEGYETLAPLVIHNVPEPGALALVVLGGLASLRRRK